MNNRREFLITGMRAIVFGGVVATGAILGLRKPSDGSGDSTCPPETLCKGCSKLNKCVESRALEYKNGNTHGQ
jgi:hypothetical protein